VIEGCWLQKIFTLNLADVVDEGVNLGYTLLIFVHTREPGETFAIRILHGENDFSFIYREVAQAWYYSG